MPIFVLDTSEDGWRPGAAARWWLHGSLEALAADLERRGTRLVLRRGVPVEEIAALVRICRAGAVCWNRASDPVGKADDEALLERLAAHGVAAELHEASLLFAPHSIATQSGTPFRVFTPFWRACLAAVPPATPLPRPRKIAGFERKLRSERLDSWHLLPRRPDWAGGLRTAWVPGEAAAQRQLTHFLDRALADYPRRRDRPGQEGTSRLSPHLAWGELSARQVWHAVHAHAAAEGRAAAPAAAAFLRELGWREFGLHLARSHDSLDRKPLRPAFARMPWRRDAAALRAWQRGLTGYPMVDAGMRELWSTGWMHNRVRMIVASFLAKHLLLDWRLGEDWFRDTLVDADYGSNTMNWQWVAGSGIDAAPYFRIFNPVLQGEKLDPEGDYVRRWVPELAGIAGAAIHRPWRLSAAKLVAADVKLGDSYPAPIVDHDVARRRALAAFAGLRSPPAINRIQDRA